jgi:flagellar M-ring protein FliF
VGEYLLKVGSQIREFIVGLSPGRKLGLIATMAFVVVAMTGLFMWAGQKTYRPLMTNLTPEDANSVMRVLRERKIPFRVDDGGQVIEIPPEYLYDLRLELATLGLPESGASGYELFDNQSLGTTSFVQKINQKRALEGELIRTIQTMNGVRRARIHLALPEKSAFMDEQKKPTASVVLDLAPGTRLDKRQVYGVGVLVARAVEGLEVDDVVIVNASGAVLSENHRDPLVAKTATQHDFQGKIERNYERRIEEMLGRVVGEGRVVARVTADLDFSQVTETQTLYDSDSPAIRSEQRNIQNMSGTRPGAGVPGAVANAPGEGGQGAFPEIRQNTERAREVTNYEIPQTVRRTIRPFGSVKRLSVAVVVDGREVRVSDDRGRGLASETQAWSPDDIEEFKALVESAVGLDPRRGDTISVRNMEFHQTDFAHAEQLIAESERRAYMKNMLIYSVIGLIIALFFIFVVRPFIKWITENTIDSVDTYLPQTVEELEKLQKNAHLPGLEGTAPIIPDSIDPEKVEGEMIRERILTLIDQNPRKAAMVITEWFKEGSENVKRNSDQTA